jgi:hypothetical protein
MRSGYREEKEEKEGRKEEKVESAVTGLINIITHSEGGR